MGYFDSNNVLVAPQPLAAWNGAPLANLVCALKADWGVGTGVVSSVRPDFNAPLNAPGTSGYALFEASTLTASPYDAVIRDFDSFTGGSWQTYDCVSYNCAAIIVECI
jgi:hypothetical protein